jgi:predicted TIM-barrel fold metal-dependent hydrolase
MLRPVAGVTSIVIRLTGLFRHRPETPTISTETGTVWRASKLNMLRMKQGMFLDRTAWQGRLRVAGW